MRGRLAAFRRASGGGPYIQKRQVDSQLHLHPFRIEVEAVALLGHVADAWPCEVVREQRDLLVRQHAEHLHARLCRLLRVGIVLELG